MPAVSPEQPKIQTKTQPQNPSIAQSLICAIHSAPDQNAPLLQLAHMPGSKPPPGARSLRRGLIVIIISLRLDAEPLALSRPVKGPTAAPRAAEDGAQGGGRHGRPGQLVGPDVVPELARRLVARLARVPLPEQQHEVLAAARPAHRHGLHAGHAAVARPVGLGRFGLEGHRCVLLARGGLRDRWCPLGRCHQGCGRAAWQLIWEDALPPAAGAEHDIALAADVEGPRIVGPAALGETSTVDDESPIAIVILVTAVARHVAHDRSLRRAPDVGIALCPLRPGLDLPPRLEVSRLVHPGGGMVAPRGGVVVPLVGERRGEGLRGGEERVEVAPEIRLPITAVAWPTRGQGTSPSDETSAASARAGCFAVEGPESGPSLMFSDPVTTSSPCSFGELSETSASSFSASASSPFPSSLGSITVGTAGTSGFGAALALTA
ncbi:hypothetical protein VP1G_11279 [Cytospora mali]|uniref:Uncharacterized protein n=1 Tax=Cytospora mali TaxID=578113 RepID=A0A194VAM3_CYTMA|nr:hypothetical protein VP1G_11279 [Valsa mali var. pyri (nom. inval.)]